MSAVLLAACTDDVLTDPLLQPRLNAVEAQPQVVTVDMSNLAPFSFAGPQYESGRLSGWHSWSNPTVFFTDVRTEENDRGFWEEYEQPPRLDGGKNWATEFPGRQNIRGSIGVGWSYDRESRPRYSTILFSQTVSSVRLAVLPAYSATLRCTTGDGTTVSSRTVILEPPNGWGSWEEVEVSGSGIRTCSMDATFAFIRDVRIIPEPRQQLQLTCTGDHGANRVTRGEEIRCTARSTTPGTLTITGWSFEGEPREDGDVTSTTWEGVMVRGGAVRVEGQVAGQVAASAAATITVLDRDWGQERISFHVAEDTEGQIAMVQSPTTSEDLGKFYPRIEVADLEQAVPIVATGPNAGMAYLADFPFSVIGLVGVNRGALAEGSAFWSLQPPRRFTTTLGEERCARTDVVPFISVVLEHEGMTMGPRSHAFFFNEELQKHNPQPVENLTSTVDTENGVDGARSAIMRSVEQWFVPVYQAAGQNDDRADSISNRPTYCIFRYFR